MGTLKCPSLFAAYTAKGGEHAAQGAMTKGGNPKPVPDLLGMWHLVFDGGARVRDMWFLTQPPSQLDHQVWAPAAANYPLSPCVTRRAAL